MSGKRYSAGSIFLQVEPVFADFQRSIKRQVEDIDKALGDDMEKVGQKAGQRAGKAMADEMDTAGREASKKYAGHFENQLKSAVKSAEREIGRLDLSTATDKMLDDLDKAKVKLRALKDQDFSVDFNADEVVSDIAAIKAAIEGLTRGKHEINIDANMRKAIRDLESGLAFVDKELGRDRKIEVEVDTKPAERQMGTFEKNFKKAMDRAASHLGDSFNKESRKLRDELKYLEGLRINVEVSGDQARREMQEIMTDLRRVMETNDDIDVKIDAARAFSELAALDRQIEAVDGQRIDVNADVDTARAEAGLRRLSLSGDQASNTFRSFNAVILATALAGPALIPIIGALAGALLAIGPAAAVAAAGLSSMLLGFSGVSAAVEALQKSEEQSAQATNRASKARETAARAAVDGSRRIADARRGVVEAERAVVDAQRGVADAERAVADAARRTADVRRQAAEQVANAIDSQREAQERYRDSIQAVRDAELELANARRDARSTGAEIRERISDNRLAQDQALLDLSNATAQNNAVQSDGSATAAEREQSRINLERAKDALSDLRREAAEMAAEQRKWRREGVDGTTEVQSAQERLNEAVEAQQDALEAVGESSRAVDEARADGARSVADAIRDQKRAVEEVAVAQEGVARAQEGVVRARENVTRAQEDAARAQKDAAAAAEALAIQQANYLEDFNKLGPAGQRFAKFIHGLRGQFHAFRNDVQKVFLPQVEAAMRSFFGSDSGAVLRQAIINLADSFGRLIVLFSQSLQSSPWLGFFQMLATLGPQIQNAFGRGFIALFEALASIMTTLAPYTLAFANGFARMMRSFADWAASEEGANGFRGFMDAVREMAPKVLAFFGAFAKFLTAAAVALAPYAEVILGMVTSLLNFLAELDSGVLGVILTGLIVVIAAAQAAYAVGTLILGLGALFAGVGGTVVFTVVGIALAIAFLASQSEGFRNFMSSAWNEISSAVSSAWEQYLKPALMNFAGAVTELWKKVLQPFLVWLGPIAVWVFKTVLVQAMKAASQAFNALAWIIRNIIIPVFQLIGKVVVWLWENAFKPAMKFIGAALEVVGKVIIWIWNKIIKPTFKSIGKAVLALWKGGFKVALVFIKAAWKAAFTAMKWVWEKVLKPVFEAIGKVLKWLWEKVAKPYFGYVKNGWKKLADGIRWVWKNVLKPVFDYLADKTLPKLKNAFRVAVDAIKKIWDGLKKVVGSPIKFVIDTIINKGLIGGFNKVAKWVGEDGFDPIPVPKWMQKYASGGVMPGYTPGRDVHHFRSPTGGDLLLSGGEAVMRPEWTAAIGPSAVDQMNAVARAEGVGGVRRMLSSFGYRLGGVVQQFAKGGLVHPTGFGGIGRTYPGHGNSRDLAGPMGSLIKAIADGRVTSAQKLNYSYGYHIRQATDYGEIIYAHMSRLLARAGQVLKAGDVLGLVGSTGNSTGPHLHIESPNGPSMVSILAGSAPRGKYGQGAADAGPSIPGFIRSFFSSPLKAIKGWVSDTWGKASDSVTSSPVWDYVKKVPQQMVGGVKDWIWSKTPGWIKSSVDVAKDAFGAAKDTVGDVADAVGLARGGILPYNGAMKYDSGGYLPPGLTTVVNMTGKPEPVFTNDQWEAMDSTGGGSIHYEPHFIGSDLTAADVAGDLNFQIRRIRRQGKYGGIG